MKKRNKLFSIAALAVSAATMLTIGACTNDSSSDDGTDETPVRELTWTVADFETWETGMQLIRIRDLFGALHENSDPAFVKSGEKSLEIRPMGGYFSPGVPIFSFPTVSERFGYDNSDFTDAKEITFEFYNNEEEPINVSVGVTTEFSKKTVKSTPFNYQPLAPKQWTTVKYTLNHNMLAIDYDLKAIEGIYVAFENSHSLYEADAPEIYLDDVVLHRYETVPTIQNIIELDEYEFLDFEKEWQQYVMRAKSTDAAPTATIRKASDCKVGVKPADGEEDTRETLTAPSGENVLHIQMPADKTGTTYNPALMISDKVFKQSYFNGLPESEYGNVKMGFDIFVDSDTMPRLLFMLHSDKNGLVDANENLRVIENVQSLLKPYEWVRIEFTIKDLYEAYQVTNPNNKDLFLSPGEVYFQWRSFQGEDKDVYIDNIGFTWEEKDATAAPTISLSTFARRVSVGTTLELPTATFYDRYDLTGKVSISAQYKDGDEWVDVTYDGSDILVDKAGDYKIIATSTNSLGNTTTNEYPFVGVSASSSTSRIWADYTYADETDGIFLTAGDGIGNEVTWLESVTDGYGTTREGVVKAYTSNGTGSGAGFIGFQFSEQLLEEAKAAKWDYFTIDVLIETSAKTLKNNAPVTSVTLRSGAVTLGTYETGKWIQIKITKDMLNSETASWVNDSLKVLDDDAFYDSFNEICGSAVSRLFFARQANGTTFRPADFDHNDLTYYIDQITWGCEGDVDEDVFVGEGENGDDFAYDVYDDEWADPFKKDGND